MNLREAINNLMYQGYVMKIKHAEDMFVDLFKKWALEMVGENCSTDHSEHPDFIQIEHNSQNNTRDEIRQHIEEGTK